LNQGLNMKFRKSLFVSSLMAAFIPSYVFACASCGCILSTDWDAQGISGAAGIRLDLRYDYLDQKQYRSGSNKISKDAVDAGGNNEVENKTTNHYVTAGIDYSPSRDWGINVQIPYIDRYHETYGEPGSYPYNPLSTSHTKSIGDIKVIGRYLISGYNLGLQLGVKLPTGDYKENFKSGESAGTRLDRGLQPGSGTTDLLIGVYHFGSINKDWDYYAQAMAQIPTNTKDGYQPGNSLNLNFGVRYLLNDYITPQLQINTKVSGRDSEDSNAATGQDSGGTLVYLSPGVTVNVQKDLRVYGFVQLPIYQYVNGNQLTPTWIGTLGARYNF
jgi:hypothetical protein